MELVINKSNKKLLILDVCDTLYPVNTTMGFIDFCIVSRSWRFFSCIRSLFIVKALNVVLYKLSKVDLIRIVSVFFLKGYSQERLKLKAREYIDSLVAIEQVQLEVDMRRNGDWDVVLASASLEPIVNSICIKYHFKGYLSSELAYDLEDVCLGKIVKDALDNKFYYIEKISKEYSHVTFITDNKGDSNCLPCVDEFIAVVPLRNKADVFFWNGIGVDKVIEL